MLKQGDTLDDRSGFTLEEGDENGRAILTDGWGIHYVTDENSQIQYVGDNPISAEVEYLLPEFGLED